jgi:16S rRNA (cytosine1402-N4)-methyltransferase
MWSAEEQPGGDDAASEQPPDARPRRRQRYSGTHPRRYEHRYKEMDQAKYPGMQAHVRAQGRTPAGTHVPVLVREVMAWLRPAPGETIVDCTVGYGGHAAELMKRIGSAGRLVGLDVDGPELERTRHRLAVLGVPFRPRRTNFAGVARVLAEEGIDKADIIFADLGVSSMQVDDPARGFSYRHGDSPLDMRMDDRLKRTAADVLATISEADLSAALRDLSDEPDHAKIAAWIARQRRVAPIARTGQLIRLVFNAKGTTEKAWRKRADYHDLHPAARTFQALRILVNDELAALRELLRIGPTLLRPGGRLGIISFHSGEDRLVKNAFRDGKHAGTYSAISEHVIRPDQGEVRSNPRSASAKFRWARGA